MDEAPSTSRGGKSRSTIYRQKVKKYVSYLTVNRHDPFLKNLHSSSSENDEQQQCTKKRRRTKDIEYPSEAPLTDSDRNLKDNSLSTSISRNQGNFSNTSSDEDGEARISNFHNAEWTQQSIQPDDDSQDQTDNDSDEHAANLYKEDQTSGDNRFQAANDCDDPIDEASDEYMSENDSSDRSKDDGRTEVDSENQTEEYSEDEMRHRSEQQSINDTQNRSEDDIDDQAMNNEDNEPENPRNDSNEDGVKSSTDEEPSDYEDFIGRPEQANDDTANLDDRSFLDHRLTNLTMPLQCKENVTAKDHLLVNIAMSLKYHVPYEMTLDMLKWIDTTVHYSGLPKSKKGLWSALCRDDRASKRHLYCRNCRVPVGEGSTITRVCRCGSCGPEKSDSQVAYFLEISLEAQLRELFSIPGIANSLKYRYRRKKKDPTAIEDIYDAEEYKKLCEPGEFLHYLYNFSYIFFTDGANVSKSSNASAWPIFIQIVEFSPHARKKHILLTGIWVDEKGPMTNSFLKPFVREANELYNVGITWKPDGEHEVTSKFIPIIFSADSKARYDVLRMTQFNGQYGCTFCYAPGVYLPGKGCQAKYPVENKSALRTDKEIRDMAVEAFNTKDKVFGIKGPSVLRSLPEFNMSSGVIVDSMHNAYLGVLKQHTLMLLEDADKPWYIGAPKDIALIDQRMLEIKLPSRVSRRPRSLTYVKQYKASEWRNFGYYCLPCLHEILPKKYLMHLALLCNALYILNKDSLTVAELDAAESALSDYTRRYQKYFGIGRMTYNIHLLSHVCESVRNWGPFWVHTAFIFESMNRKIIDTITSPNGIAWQIYTRFLMTKFIQNASYDPTVSEATRNFISGLLNIRSNDYNLDTDNETRVRLEERPDGKRQPLAWEDQVLRESGYECSELREFRQIWVNGIEYRCKNFKPNTKFDNSIVSCNSTEFGEIVGIVSFSTEKQTVEGLFIKRLRRTGYAFSTNYISKVTETDRIKFVAVNSIRGPAVKIKTRKGLRIIPLPNVWETD